MRTPIRGLLVLVGALALIPAGEAAAQRRRGLVDVSPDHARRGFWLSVGLAAGGDSWRFSDEPNYTDALWKPTFALALGGTVNPHFRLGGELKVWADEYFDEFEQVEVTESLVGALLVGQFYPSRRMGLFVKGGVGVSRSGADVEFGSGSGETGFSTLLGAGYEARLGRSIFITPYVDLMQHRSSERNQPTLRERLVSFGVNMTFQVGR